MGFEESGRTKLGSACTCRVVGVRDAIASCGPCVANERKRERERVPAWGHSESYPVEKSRKTKIPQQRGEEREP